MQQNLKMGNTDYTKYLQTEKEPPYQWYDGDRNGNILSFFWLEERLIIVIQNQNGNLIKLIISEI